jgi:hypothetical protein
MWKKNVQDMSWITKNQPDMSQNKLWKEKKLILPWIKWIKKKNRNIVTSIFLKLHYIIMCMCVHVSHAFKSFLGFVFQLWQKCYSCSLEIHVF